MADPGRTQQSRPGPPLARPGPVPAGTIPGRGPGAAPGWAPAPPGAQRYQGQPTTAAPYFAPRPGAPGQAVPGQVRPAPGGRGPVPPGAPGVRQRPGDVTQIGPQRPRPPGAPPGRQPQYAPQPPAPAPATTRRGKKLLVRDVGTRRVIRRVDVWTVFKLSMIFYFCVLVMLVAAGVVLWNVAATFGVITSVDKLVRSLFALRSFKLHPESALIWGTAAGGALCLLGVVVNTVAVVFYNLLSDIVGGVQVVAVSDKER